MDVKHNQFGGAVYKERPLPSSGNVPQTCKVLNMCIYLVHLFKIAIKLPKETFLKPKNYRWINAIFLKAANGSNLTIVGLGR